jgi:hypothetical protein
MTSATTPRWVILFCWYNGIFTLAKTAQSPPVALRATCLEMGDALDVVIEGALAQTHTPEESIVVRSFRAFGVCLSRALLYQNQGDATTPRWVIFSTIKFVRGGHLIILPIKSEVRSGRLHNAYHEPASQ